MNRVTMAERQKILDRALELVKLDRDLAVIDPRGVESALGAEFGISRERCRTAVAKAARIKRASGK